MDRDDEGRYTETKTDRDVLDAVAAHEPAGTAEIADALDVTRQAADYRLRRLRDAGRVESKMIGAALAWRLAGGESEASTGGEQGERAASGALDDKQGRTEVSGERDTLDERIRALNLPGSGTRLDLRVAATVRVVEHLEREREATADELKGLLDADSIGYASVESYWTNWIRGAEVLKQLAEIETPGKGEKTYRFRGRE